MHFQTREKNLSEAYPRYRLKTISQCLQAELANLFVNIVNKSINKDVGT
jgi:hypothetical protein